MLRHLDVSISWLSNHCGKSSSVMQSLMQMSIRVNCGKGTYIRSLARDIGRALNSGAYLTALCRTRLGDVSIDDCITLDDFPQWLDSQEIITSE